MNREDIVEVLQSCVLIIDGCSYEDYKQLGFKKELWDMGGRLRDFMVGREYPKQEVNNEN